MFSQSIPTMGGNQPLTSCTATGLPANLSAGVDPMNTSNCLVSGTPAMGTAGMYTIVLTATDTDAGGGASTTMSAMTPLTINPPLMVPAFTLEDGTEGRAFLKSIPTTGGQQPLTACSATGLPMGLVIGVDPGNNNNCRISGMPAAMSAGMYMVTVTATDTATASTGTAMPPEGVSAATALTINPPLTIPAFMFGNGTEGQAYSQSVASAGGNQPLTACTAMGLPAGLTIGVDPMNTSNCLVSGTPAMGTSAMSPFSVTITATDTATPTTAAAAPPEGVSAATNLTVNGPFAVPAFVFGNGTEGRAFSQSIPTTGGNQPLTACMATGLPMGLMVGVDPMNTSNCLVSGTPAMGSSSGSPYSVVISATDTGTMATPPTTVMSAATSLTINPPLMVPAFVLGNGSEGLPYSQSIPTTGGQQPLTACSAMGLPMGLMIAVDPGNTSNCLISGTPAMGSAGMYMVTVTATDTATTSTGTAMPPEGVSAATNLTINPALMVPAFAFGAGVEGRAFSQSIPSAGGNQPLTACSAMGLPMGLMIAVDPGNTSNCLVSGMPAAGSAAMYSVTITATDTPTTSGGPSMAMSAATNLTIFPPLTVPAFAFGAGTEGRAFSQSIPTAGGIQPLTACSAMGLPAGLMIAVDPMNSSNCLVSGTPAMGSAGMYSVTITATDSTSTSTGAAMPPEGVSAATGLTINAPLTVPTFMFPDAKERVAYSFSVPTAGGQLPLTNCSALGLPMGLMIGVDPMNTANCLVSGTPASGTGSPMAITYPVTITATDSPTVSTAAAVPPEGVSAPTNLTVQPALSIPAFMLGNGTEGRAFVQSIPTINGTYPLSACTAMGLPLGLVIGVDPMNTMNCLISGTPAAGASVASPYSVTVTAFDSGVPADSFSSAPTALVINAPLAIPPFMFGNGTEGQAFSQSIATTGGNQPLTACMAVGLPLGLMIGVDPMNSSNCLVSGTPAMGSAGMYMVTVTATDTASTSTASGMASSALTDLKVNAPLAVTAFVLGNGTEGRAFSQTVQSTGGNQPLTACMMMGAPAGLTIAVNPMDNSQCLISGMPNAGTAAGSPYTVTVTVTDTPSGSTTGMASNMSALTINPPLTVPAFTFGIGVEDRAFSQSIPTTGGNLPLTNCTAMGLPPSGNLTIGVDPMNSSNCLVSGTPTNASGDAGMYSVTITATDTASSSTAAATPPEGVSAATNLTINQALMIPAFVFGAGTENQAFSQSIPTTGGTGTLATCMATNLPSSLVIAVDPMNSANCLVSGTPDVGQSAMSPFSVTIDVTDAATASTAGGGMASSAGNNLVIFPEFTIPAFTLGDGVEGRTFQEIIPTMGGDTSQDLVSCMATGLPSGLNIEVDSTAVSPVRTCRIFGTPAMSSAGMYTVVVTANDVVTTSTTPVATSAMTPLTINAPLTVPAFTFGVGVEDRAFSQSIPTTGGIQPLTACMATGLPPSGNLTIGVDPMNTSNCLVSGTPTNASGDAGMYTVTITATDTASSSTAAATPPEGVSAATNLTINQALMIPAFVFGAGTENQAFSQSIPTTGGTGTLATCMATNLPSSLVIAVDPMNSANCLVSGTPAMGQSAMSPFSVTIDVTDAATASTGSGMATSAGNNLDIFPEFTIPAFTLGDGVEGRMFEEIIPTMGGDTSQDLVSCMAMGLPSGLMIEVDSTAVSPVRTCRIFGMPAAMSAGMYTVVVTANDVVTTSTTPVAMSAMTPLTINAPLMFTPDPPVLANAFENTPYNQVVATMGGIQPLTSCTAMGLPSGLNIATDPMNGANCLITGSPDPGTAAASPFTVTISATDSASTSTAMATIMSMAANQNVLPQLTIADTTLGNGTEGLAFSESVPTSGGNTAISLMSCMLAGGPSGLSASVDPMNNRNCLIDGTPAVTSSSGGMMGTYMATLTATEGGGAPSAMATITITINPALGFVTASPLPVAVAGRAYSFTVVATGGEQRTAAEMSLSGCGDFTFADNMGDLDVTSAGPAAAGTCTFTMRITSQMTTSTASAFQDMMYTLPINAALQLTLPAIPAALRLSPYNPTGPGITFTPSGGSPPYRWNITTAGTFTCGASTCTGVAATACEGFTLDRATGALTGTPANAGASGASANCVFDLELTDDFGDANTAVASGTVNQAGVTITVLNNNIYVAQAGNEAIRVVSTSTELPVASIASGGTDPEDVVVAPTGLRAYVTLKASNQIAVVNTTNNTLVGGAPVALPANCTSPQGLAITPDNMRLYVACDGGANDRIVILDPANVGAMPIATITMAGATSLSGKDPHSIAVRPSGDRVYVTMRTSNEVLVIDNSASPPGNANATLHALNSPSTSMPRGIRIVPDGDRAYIAKKDATANDQGAVEILDVTAAVPASVTGSPIINLGRLGASSAPGAFGSRVATDATGTLVYVSMPSTSANGQSFVVIRNKDAMGNNITPVEETGSPVATSNGVNNAVGITLPPAGTRVFMAENADNRLRVHDSTNPFGNGTNRDLGGGTAPRGIAHIPIPK
jgi:DNA-binding beta-propeller fold protein YncE